MATSTCFEQVMERHRHRVYTLACYSLGCPQDAEDVAQEVFVRLWRNWGTMEIERVEGWLIRVTTNACLDLRRKRATRKRAAGSYAPHVLDASPSVAGDPGEAAASSELQARVAEAITRLKEPYRAILILREIEGLPYLDISDALEMPMPSVKVNLHRARAKLAELLEPLRGEQSGAGHPREADARVH
jgi:RNA polymerase sigma-70 factor (ECF subfamily)